MNKKLKILFLGDIVGRPGRVGAREFLKEHGCNYDFVIANVENASHGYGLTDRNYFDLSRYGIHAMTSGNHIWDRKEIFEYIHHADKLIRPLNYPEGTPGKGSSIFKTDNGISIGIINMLGTVFMPPIISPWELLKNEIDKMKKETPVVILDFHAEATAEKIACAYIAAEKGISAVLGTHTHVQTADEMIMENGTAYITDVGFCGASKSIIGMDIKISVERLVKMLPARLEIGSESDVQINGAAIIIDADTGKAESIERINKIMKFSDEVN
ncbi:MAG TPA: TIGR00282 family metallophosphoesterase [Candidatus Gastranaerophilales bacterium]|nr:TIGR00282 family metallophosphoesterase [Candidatus Gastranaerophilales bacterium]